MRTLAWWSVCSGSRVAFLTGTVAEGAQPGIDVYNAILAAAKRGVAVRIAVVRELHAACFVTSVTACLTLRALVSRFASESWRTRSAMFAVCAGAWHLRTHSRANLVPERGDHPRLPPDGRVQPCQGWCRDCSVSELFRNQPGIRCVAVAAAVVAAADAVVFVSVWVCGMCFGGSGTLLVTLVTKSPLLHCRLPPSAHLPLPGGILHTKFAIADNTSRCLSAPEVPVLLFHAVW